MLPRASGDSSTVRTRHRGGAEGGGEAVGGEDWRGEEEDEEGIGEDKEIEGLEVGL